MDNNTVLSQGYMTEGDRLDTDAMRPYLNKRGQHVFASTVGYKEVKQNNGQIAREPVRQERPAVKQNALLRLYEWQEIDKAVLDVFRPAIVGISDLIAAGCTHPLGGLGTSVSIYEQLTDMTGADVSMTVRGSMGEQDRPGFNPISVPIPIISKQFTLDARTLDASRRLGESLDVTGARTAAIKVRQMMEHILFNGSTAKLGANPIYGLTTAPNIFTGTAASYGGGVFTVDGNAHKSFQGALKSLMAAGFTGPWGIYADASAYSNMMHLTGANLQETQMSVILRTIPNLKFVHFSYELPANTTVLLQLTPEVVDLAIGLDVTPVQWMEQGGLLAEYRVMTAMAPRVKSDANNACGVVYITSC